MAIKGTFTKLFEQMVDLVGSNPTHKYAILFNLGGEDYILANEDDATRMIKLDVDNELRIVLAVTYRELAVILKPRQLSMFSEVNNGDNSKGI